jgi:hypothetical protein
MTEAAPLIARRTLVWVLLVGGGAFLGAIALLLFGTSQPETVAPSAFSRSAIGHKAFAETLRRLGVPVLVSRYRSLDKGGQGSLLIVAEPSQDPGEGFGALAALPQVLLVLPKWQGRPDGDKPGWIESRAPVPDKAIDRLLQAVAPGAKLVRGSGTDAASFPAGGSFDGRVELHQPQTIAGGGLRAIINLPQGMLVAERASGDHRLWILADPDLLSNEGLALADNAAVAVALVEALRPAGAAVVIDEVLHGFEQHPNLLRLAFAPPFLMVTVAAAAALLLLLWAGTGRFGAPQASPPPLAPGKATLIGNAAGLLILGGAINPMPSRYLQMLAGSVSAALNGPAAATDAERLAWLDRVAAARHLTRRLQRLQGRAARLAGARRSDPRRALQLALAIHRWQREMLHGADRDPGAG